MKHAPMTPPLDLAAARALCNGASITAEKLDSLHGDPSKRGGWIGERDLARSVVCLVPQLIAEVERLRSYVGTDRCAEELLNRLKLCEQDVTRLTLQSQAAEERAAGEIAAWLANQEPGFAQVMIPIAAAVRSGAWRRP